MKSFFTLLCVALSFTQSIAQNKYYYQIDLKNIVDDKVKVTLKCPVIKEDAAIFVFPRVIPGSYALKEYGKFIEGIKGYDKKGNEIKITTKNNIFYINKNASGIDRIEYLVNDTWDDKDVKNFIFQPGGSNIEKDKNFVINHFAFAGYFEGYKNLPFEIEYTKPEYMVGSSWLKKEMITNNKDVVRADNYTVLADNPIMYCKPDTSSFLIDSTKINISCYSSKQSLYSGQIRDLLIPLASSLKNFLGRLPVDEYNFIFYFALPEQVKEVPGGKGLSGFGALEHNHSSLYFLSEDAAATDLRELIEEICAHEFLHIITPLNLHSKEIGDFNFMNPKMSQHLWLYEGVTEYFSWLSLVQNNLISEEKFIKDIRLKLRIADRYDPFSFTKMSENVLEDEYQEKYLSVYTKGAVVAMLLDQLLLKKSSGKYGLKHLIMDLMKKYGSNQSFEDNQLFEDIVSMTYPEVDDFINYYIKGSMSLPLQDYFGWFGYDYEPLKRIKSYFIGSFAYRFNPKGQMEVGEIRERWIDIKSGDIILAVNGTELSLETLDEVSERYFQHNPSPDEITLRILRDGKEISRTGQPKEGHSTKKHILLKSPDLSAEDKILTDAWLKGKYVK